jgi:hypothetical protein
MGYIVHTRVDLKFGQNPGFNEVLEALRDFLGNHGWKLIYGLQPVIGKLTEVIHIWEVENLDDVPNGLAAVFSDAELGKKLARLPDLMNTETLQVMVKTPYSP